MIPKAVLTEEERRTAVEKLFPKHDVEQWRGIISEVEEEIPPNTIEELQLAARNIKSGKAPGPDGIPGYREKKVSLLDTGKGETLLRNLKVYRVSTEEEAMKLLLMGDTNRMTVETPMNVYSSRSHCIFTICLIVKNHKSGKLRRSKLTLVDLAGSERISKSRVTGATLHEARHINLSLHYLEQVVTTLCQGKSHVPFRNSLLTYLLKDSLTGNCLTVLIATLAINKENVEETIATCKFAQRVADVNIEANINEEIDTRRETEFLRKVIGDLQRQLMEKTQYNGKKSLSKEEQEKWKKMVNNYLQSTKNELPINSCHIREVQYCFKLLKQTVKDQENQTLKIKSEGDIHKDLIDQYKKSIQEKEEEIQFFKSLIYNDSKPSLLSVSFNSNVMSKLNSPDKENVSPNINTSNVPSNQVMGFQAFLKDEENSNELDFYREAIRDTYEVAVGVTAVIEECQRNILDLKTKIRSDKNKSHSTRVKNELTGQQSIYQKSLSKLKDLKNQTDCLRCGLENAKLNVMKNFEKWCYEMDVHFGITAANLNRSIDFEKVSDELINQQNVNPNLFKKSHCLKRATKPFSRVVETANLNEKETSKECCDKEDYNKFSTNFKNSKHNSDKLNNELSDHHFVYENSRKQSQDLKDKTELRSLMLTKLSDEDHFKEWCNKENYCSIDTTARKFNTNKFNLETMNDEVVGQQPANRNSLKKSQGLTNETEYCNCNLDQATLNEKENFKNWCVNENYAVECHTTATASKGNKFNYLIIKDKQSADRKSQCLKKEREYLRRRLDETEYLRQKLITTKLNAKENIIQKRQDMSSPFYGKFGAATINFNKNKYNSENINDEPVDQQALYWNSPKNSRGIQDEEKYSRRELNKPKYNVTKDDSTAITKDKLIDQQQGSKDKAEYFQRSLEKSKLKKINLNQGCDRGSYGNFSATSSNFQQSKFQIQENIIPWTTTCNAMNDSVPRKYNRNASANSKGYSRSKIKSQRILEEGFAPKNNYFEQNNTKNHANQCGDQNSNSYSQKLAVYTISSPKHNAFSQKESNHFSDLYQDVQNHSNGGASNQTFFTAHNEEYLNDLLSINKTYRNNDLCPRKISTSSENILEVTSYDSDYPKEITISALPSLLHSSLKANPIITTEIENNVKPRQPFNPGSPSNRKYISQVIPEEEIRIQNSVQANNSVFQKALHEKQIVYDAILEETTAKQSRDDKTHSANYSFETPRTKREDHSKILNIRPSSSPTKINMKQHIRRSSTPTSKMNQQIQNTSFLEDDPQEFKDFMSTVPLTGDLEVDQEIINFYRTKYAIRK